MESTTTVLRAKWNTLEHNGIAFPPEYQPRGISISIDGERLMLNRDQEELVYAWAKKKDTHYVQDGVFQSNYLNDFKKLLPEGFQHITSIKTLISQKLSNSLTMKRKSKRQK